MPEDLSQKVSCKVLIKHQHSFRPGKYGLTVRRSGSTYPTGGENVAEVTNDEALFKVLYTLGYSALEINDAVGQLEPLSALFEDERLIDVAALDKCGF